MSMFQPGNVLRKQNRHWNADHRTGMFKQDTQHQRQGQVEQYIGQVNAQRRQEAGDGQRRLRKMTVIR